MCDTSPDLSGYIYGETKTLETHKYGIRSDHKAVCLELLGKTPYQRTKATPQHMTAVKLSAKFDMDLLEQAKIEFQQRIGHLHGAYGQMNKLG